MSGHTAPRSVTLVVRWYNPRALVQSGLTRHYPSVEQAEQEMARFTGDLHQRGMTITLADVVE